MKKKLLKVIVILALLLALGVAQATVQAEDDDVPLIYSIVVPFTMN